MELQQGAAAVRVFLSVLGWKSPATNPKALPKGSGSPQNSRRNADWCNRDGCAPHSPCKQFAKVTQPPSHRPSHCGHDAILVRFTQKGMHWQADHRTRGALRFRKTARLVTE